MRKAWMVMLVAALALAGCGDDDSVETLDDTPAPAQSPTTAGGMGGMGDHGHSAHAGGPANTSCNPSGTTLTIVANNISFNTDCLAAPAGQAFTLTFDNRDNVAHNIAFLESHAATEVMFRSEIFQGPGMRTFSGIGPFRAGTYAFHCEVHPNQMSGTLVVK